MTLGDDRMSTFFRSLLLLATLCVATADVMAQEQIKPPAEAPAVEPPTPPAVLELEVEREAEPTERHERRRERRHHNHDNVIMNVGDDSFLAAGETADSVIAVFGSATAEGDVGDVVMAFGGNARLTGASSEAVVAIFGDVHVDGEVRDSAVAVFGNVTLGPNAVVEGEVVSMGGKITRDPSATVFGPQQQISFGENFGRMEWLRTWFKQCFLYGRPLAFEPGLAWAWWTAFGFLALYVLLALLFDSGVQRCVTTFEERPAQTVVASILAVLLTPVLMFLLLVTVIGIALVPFLAIGLFCAGLFGKAAVLAALGRRITRFTGIGAFSHIAFATLIGGLIVMAMYVIPVFGFIAFKVVGILGLGVLVYTLLLAMRAMNERAAPVMAAATPSPAEAAIAAENGTLPPPAPEPAPAMPTNAELSTLPRAGFWIRMGALLIDFILVGVVMSMLDPPGQLFLVALAGYGALMWKLKGTTIGGIICNLRVLRTDGRDIEWETAIVRALSCFLSLIPAGLGFLWIVFDNNRQTWHDKIAGTVVVRMPRNQPLV